MHAHRPVLGSVSRQASRCLPLAVLQKCPKHEASIRACSKAAPHRLNHTVRLHRGVACSAVGQGVPASTAPGLHIRGWSNTAEEQQALAVLQKQLTELRLDPCPDQDTQRWFLRDRSLDVAETIEKLSAMTQWRQRCCPHGSINATDVAAEAATGKVVLHDQKDQFGRPVVVVRAALHRRGEFPLQDSERLCAFVIDSALQQLPESGEDILGVCDLRGFGPSNADFDFFYFLVDVFFKYYPKRLSQVLLVDSPWVFRPIWATIKPVLGKYAQLVTFISRDDLCPQYFQPATLPAAFRS